MKLYPLLIKPVYKDYIWGGSRIIETYHRPMPPGIYAESWEISDREDGMSLISNGLYKGKSLHELVVSFKDELMGRKLTGFPLLIKIIDAKQNLSVQVHPDDEKAKLLGSEAKTEMWVVLDAEPNAAVYVGCKPEITPLEFKHAIGNNTVEKVINKIEVQVGDVIYIPGGMIHAIGSGCLLYEVQQNSNTTYRIYDWNRVGKDGRPRPLHLKEAFEVIKWESDKDKLFKKGKTIEENDNGLRILMLNCPYFNIERLEIRGLWLIKKNTKDPIIFFIQEGEVEITVDEGREVVYKGMSCLIPAACHSIRLNPKTERVTILKTCIP